MHELPVMQEILAVVLKHAVRHQVEQVLAVHLQVGALSDLQEVWMQRYFDHLSQGSLAQGARLHIERKPAVFSCRDCGQETRTCFENQQELVCVSCGSNSLSLISGREYAVLNLEAV
ncbi:MAG: hydrogenase maturation nickel metallochaperone HypA [Desulfohalobiaceae bacterium]